MPVAIVTGAGSGIGRATSLALAQRGYAVALVGRTRATLDQTASQIRGATAVPVVADVSQPSQVDRMVGEVLSTLGRIDVLVNNAGVAPSIPLLAMTVEQWREVLDSNLSSAFYATRAVWPVMQRPHEAQEAGGVIVNISSMASRDPFPGLGAYAAAKSALNMLTLMTAREGDPVGIRAVAIAPGAVDTPMFRKLVGNQPIGPEMVMHPEDVAAMVVDCVTGSLRFSSGETLFMHRRPA